MTVNAFVAVRMGSTRVQFKNFRLLGGKALYQHLTDEALKCETIDRLFLNTDSQEVIDIAKPEYGASLEYYLRDPALGTSATTLDEYAYDFMKRFPSRYTVFLNPCSPFLKAKSIDNAVKLAQRNNLDACVASRTEQTHAFKNNSPINFSFDELQPRSQDLVPVHTMTSGFFIWKSSSFIKSFEENGFANFNGRFLSYGLGLEETIDIDEEADFQLAELFLRAKKSSKIVKYHPLIESMVKAGMDRRN